MKKIQKLGLLYQELGASIATILQGTFKVFPNLYLVRQNFHKDSTPTIWWTDLVRMKEFESNNQFFISELLIFFQKLGSDRQDINQKNLKNALNKYYEKFRHQNRVENFKNIFKNYSQNKFLLFLKKIKNSLFSRNDIIGDNEKYTPNKFYGNVKKVMSENPFGVKK